MQDTAKSEIVGDVTAIADFCCTNFGRPAIIFINISKEGPFPTPFSVICSENHIIIIDPVAKAKDIWTTKVVSQLKTYGLTHNDTPIPCTVAQNNAI